MKTSLLSTGNRFRNSLLLVLFATNLFAQQVSFTTDVTKGCVPLKVKFTNTSSKGTTFYWNFKGIGLDLNNKAFDTSYIYTEPGQYTPSVTAFDSMGVQIASFLTTITVDGVPSTFSSADSACIMESISFSLYSQSTIKSYLWNFGDSSTSTQSYPSHSYSKIGTYNVTLIANTTTCGSDTLSKIITIKDNLTPAKPSFSMGKNNVCPGEMINFYPNNYNAKSYKWTFGNGDSSSLQSTSYTYTKVGNYPVTLTVTNACGLSSSYTDTAKIGSNIGFPSYVSMYASPKATCPGDSISFSFNQNASNYLWKFTSMDSSVSAYPKYAFKDTGTYPVTLKATNGCGKDTTLATTVNISKGAYYNSYASMFMNPNPVYAGNSVSFYYNTSNAKSNLWDFGDSTTSNQSYAYHTYKNAGTYKITLTLTNACGKDTVLYGNLVVNAAVQVSFTTDTTSGCAPLTVKFTNTSSTGIKKFSWYFSDGTPAWNGTDTTHIFQNTGQYYVTLTAYDSSGNYIGSSSVSIIVNGVPSTFYASADSACIMENISFSLSSSSQTTIKSYLWNFGDSSTSTQSYPSHSYSKIGTYNVTLIANTTTCGSDTLSKIITIKDNLTPAKPYFSMSKNNVCPGELIYFYSNTYNAKSFKWTFGNGDTSVLQSPSYTYTKSGNYPVTLTVYNACGKSNSYTDTARISNSIGFSSYSYINAYPNATCPGSNISFNFNQNATTYLWKFGNGDSSVSAYPQYAYKDTGTYQATLKATNGCGKDTTLTTSVSISNGVYYNSYAYMFMNPNPVYAGNNVNFYYNTSNAKSSLWNFGDSTTSNQSYANHTYKNAGTYKVSLTLTNGCGKDTVLYGNITVNPAVQVSFTADKTSGCSPLTVKFTNTSSTGIKKFSWNFGNTSQTWNGFDTTYIFQNSGQYYVSLTAYDSLGNYMGSYNSNISVNSLPTTFYSTTDTACPNQSISFNVDSKSVTINSYSWNFGDSTTSNQQYPNHSYSNMSTYKVTLMLNTSCGNDTLTKSIVVNNGALPNAQFYINNNGNICPGDKISFYPKDYMSKTYSWNFGDSATSTIQSPTHSYAKIGNYAVTLTITNSCGQTNKYTDTARIGNVPFPSWINMYSSASQACPGDNISFSYNYQSTAQLWKFGDGDSSMTTNPKHAYKNTGNYNVTVKLTNGCGKDTTLTTIVSINNGLYFGTNVYMDIKPNPAYTGKDVTFGCSTSASTYFWNFGDSTTSASQYPLHTYNKAGTYNVSLKLTNGCGKDTTLSRSLIVNDVPQISFTADKTTGCTPLTVTFTNTSSNVNNYSWSWSYNDGSQWTNGVNATHTFTKSGNFNVTLNANDQYGNYVSSYSLQITVNGAPSNFYTSADTACPGQTVGFSVWSQSPINSALWNFGDSATSNQQNTGHSFAVSGTYLVKLIVGTSCGYDTLQKSIVVNNNSTPDAKFHINNSNGSFCPGDPIQFNPRDCCSPSYIWKFGDGDSLISNNKNGSTVTHAYKQTGNYAVTLTITNSCGNSNTYTDTVRINNTATFPTWLNIYTSSTSICPGDAVNFDYSYSAASQLWNFGDGDTSSVKQVNHTYSKVGTYNVTVDLMNGCGSKTTLKTTITVGNNTPFSGNPYIHSNVSTACPGDKIYFGANTTAATYLWKFGNGDSSTVSDPAYSFSKIGIYNVSLKLVNNCGKDTTVFTTIKIDTALTPSLNKDMFGAPAATACVGDTMLFYSVGGASYLWDFGDGQSTTQTSPLIVSKGDKGGETMTLDIVKHVYKTLGNYIVKLTYYNSCGKSASDTMTVSIGTNQAVNGGMAPTSTSYKTCEQIDFIAIGGTKYQWTFGDGDSVTTNAGSTSHTYTKAGNYTVSVAITNSCGNVATYTNPLTIVPIPTPTITANGATLIASSAASYQWSMNGTTINGATASSYVATQSGMYSVTITDANGCTATSAAVCYANANAGADVSICSGGNVKLTATGGGSYLWNTKDTLPFITVMPSTTVTYFVTVAIGSCTATDSVTVSVATTLTANAGKDVSICQGDKTTLTATGGGNYTWTPSTGLSDATIANPVATPSVTTTYMVKVTSGACSSSDTVVVTVKPIPATPTITTNGATTFCQGGNVTLTSSAVNSNKWSTGDTTQSIKVSQTGNYSVTVSNGGCTATSTATSVTVNSLPTVTAVANGATTFCQGGNVSLTASNGSSYLWTNGATAKNTTATTSGDYSVTITDANGCSATSAPVTVTVNQSPTTPAITANGATTFCQGGSVTLTSDANSYYTWSNGATTQSITVTSAGNYSVKVTNTKGCTATSDATSVTVNSLPSTPTITASGATTFCAGGSVTLTSNSVNHKWSTGDTTASIVVTKSGNYTVSTTGSNGCSATSAPTTVTVNPLPSANAGADVFLCSGGNVKLNATGGDTYSWTPTTALSASNIANPVASPTSNTTYIVTVTLGSCTAKDTVTVSVASALTVNAGKDTSVCFGSKITLNATGGGNYAWSPSTGLSDTTISNPVASPSTTTAYIVKTTSGTCSNTDTVIVTVKSLPATPTITTGMATSLCPGVFDTLFSSTASSYKWSSGEISQGITDLKAGSYTVTVTNASGCSATSAAITVNPLPIVTITANGATTFCNGDSVKLTASNGATYLWSNNATSSAITVKTGGNYTVKVTDANGCSATSSAMAVTVNSLPTAAITAGGTISFCSGDSVKLTASNGTSYNWNNGASTSAITAKATGSYTVKVTDANGCSAISSAIMVTANPLPTKTITTGGATSFCSGGSVKLTAGNGTSYLWNNGATIQNISATTSGDYSVTITDANGCSATSAPVTVTVNQSPTTPAITANGATTFCQGGSVTLTSDANSYYTWSNGATTQSITVTSAGNYSVKVTNTKGCTATSDATSVTVNSLPSTPTITAGGTTTFCAGGSVTLTSIAGNSYKWSTGDTTASIVVTQSGSYTVSTTGSNGCSATSAPTTVTVNPLPSANAGADVFICSGGNVKLNASGGDTYSWVPTTALSASNIANPVASPTSNTTYTVTVTLGSCTAKDSVVVSVAAALVANAGKDTSVCFGDKITMNASGGGNYLWTPSTGLSDSTVANPVASPNTNTTYIVKMSSGVCSSTDTVVVSVKSLPSAPSITTGSATSFCQGGSVTLTSSTGSSYKWSSGETTASISATKSGNYTVTITNAGGCSGTSSATTVTVNSLPTATITANGATTFCNGDSVKLTASNGATYLWSNNATSSAITVKTGGNYTVKVTDANGCSATSSAMAVTVNSLPIPIIGTISGTNAVCIGNSITLTASGGTKYAWNTSDTTTSITVTPTKTTTYSVTVMNANCSKITNATVTVNSLPSVPTITAGGATSFCQGGSVTLASSAANSYKWSNGDTTQSISATNTGNYTVTITNASGCTATSSATTITVNSLPSDTITASGNTSFCNGDSVKLTASSGASYLWSTNATTQSITVKTAGSYTVKIIDANGCSVTSSATTITVNQLPTATITAGATTFCSGDSVKLTASTGTSYLWSNGASTSTILAKSAGNYTVKVTDANGCTATSSATTVTVNQLPTSTITAGGATTFCSGDSVKLTASTGTSYLWSNGATTSVIAAKSAGNYTVKVTDANGCSVTSSPITIGVNPLPAANAGSNQTICKGDSTIIGDGTAVGNTYNWTPNTGISSVTIANPTVTPLVTATWTLTETITATGCAKSNSVTVTVNSLPTATITAGGTTSFCSGDSVKLTASNGISYLWSNGASTPAIAAKSAGNYTVKVTDANGCSATSSSTTVVVKSLPLVAISGNTSVCKGDSTILTTSGATTYLWNTSSTSASITITPIVNTTYIVTGTDANGCKNKDTIVVKVNPLPTKPVITLTGDTLTATTASTYQWSLDGAPINGATTQSYLVLKTGNYKVTITDANGCSNTSDSMYVDITGIQELTSNIQFTVYPNPFSDKTTITYSLTHQSPITLEVYNILGKKIATLVDANQNTGDYKVEFSAKELGYAEGVYFVRMKMDKEVRTMRVIEIE